MRKVAVVGRRRANLRKLRPLADVAVNPFVTRDSIVANVGHPEFFLEFSERVLDLLRIFPPLCRLQIFFLLLENERSEDEGRQEDEKKKIPSVDSHDQFLSIVGLKLVDKERCTHIDRKASFLDGFGDPFQLPAFRDDGQPA
jgi:hypothetical protein